MARIPTPRAPRCYKHGVWIAACPACHDAHTPAVKARA